jgi:hypothetical protein
MSAVDERPLGPVFSDRDAQRLLLAVDLQTSVAAIFVQEVRRVAASAAASAAGGAAGGAAGSSSAAATTLQKELAAVSVFGNARTKAGMFSAHAPPAPPVAEGRCAATEVAVKLIILESGTLAFRLMAEYRLPPASAFQGAVRALGRAKQSARIAQVLADIKVYCACAFGWHGQPALRHMVGLGGGVARAARGRCRTTTGTASWKRPLRPLRATPTMPRYPPLAHGLPSVVHVCMCDDDDAYRLMWHHAHVLYSRPSGLWSSLSMLGPK